MRLLDNAIPEFILLYFKRQPTRRIVYAGVESINIDGTKVIGKDYIVQPGDTLTDIAHYHGTTWQEVASQNHIINPHLIYPGQVVHFTYTVTY